MLLYRQKYEYTLHKYFAKTLFLGKKIDFLPQCQSTNSEMLLRLRQSRLQEGYLIHTDEQISGRGQRGNSWLSEPQKNLLFSLHLKPVYLLPKEAYLINIIAGLALVDCLKLNFQISAELKWPNDVYVGDRKIAGILVETIIDQKTIGNAVVGVGLNVNQNHFHLPTATSLKMELGMVSDRMELLESLIMSFEKFWLMIRNRNTHKLLKLYYEVLRWRGELHYFKASNGEFQGEIIGIDETGRLIISSNQKLLRFDVKEITFLY